jgi:hypothetical protein
MNKVEHNADNFSFVKKEKTTRKPRAKKEETKEESN